MKEYKVDNHISSFLPDNKNWKLIWSDEFDGAALDTDKWSFRRHLFHKEHLCYIGDEGIEFDGNSNIIFKLIKKDGHAYSSQLQTGENFLDRPSENKDWLVAPFSKQKFLHSYGYYEVRCKMQQTSDWWSAFWLQSPIIGASEDPKTSGIEVDIMESFKPNNIIPHFLHWAGYSNDHKVANTMNGEPRYATDEDRIKLNGDKDTYHTFGLHWQEDGYTFYVDGKQSGRKITEVTSSIKDFILIGTECFGYRNGIPGVMFETNASNSDVTDTFTVDYVRVFDEI